MKTKKDNIPVNYGMNALAMFSEQVGKSMNELINMNYDKLNYMELLTLLWCGVLDGARKEKQECKFATRQDFIDYLDDNKEVVGELIGLFTTQQAGESESDKKK